MPDKSATTPDSLQIQYLMDRMAISDLVTEFARALDDRDWTAYSELFVEDAVVTIPPNSPIQGRAAIAEFATKLAGFAGTHHLISNLAVDIQGDEATSRAYLIAAHILEPDNPARHADGAGWYRHKIVRTDSGWRFAAVSLEVKYFSGEPLRF